ncbi:F-actin-uncapping protein LRRC16A-like, partial [Nilaparvata lugens]
MVKCVEEQCPTVFGSERVQDDVRKMCQQKSRLEPEFVRTCILEQAGTNIMNKVNELSLAVASHVSDRLTDEVIESLSKSHKSL